MIRYQDASDEDLAKIEGFWQSHNPRYQCNPDCLSHEGLPLDFVSDNGFSLGCILHFEAPGDINTYVSIRSGAQITGNPDNCVFAVQDRLNSKRLSEKFLMNCLEFIIEEFQPKDAKIFTHTRVLKLRPLNIPVGRNRPKTIPPSKYPLGWRTFTRIPSVMNALKGHRLVEPHKDGIMICLGRTLQDFDSDQAVKDAEELLDIFDEHGISSETVE